MKVLLVSPPSFHLLREVVSLGLLSLATVARQEGVEIRILDANACNHLLENDEVIQAAKDYAPDVIGINLMTPFVPNCYRLVKMLKPLGAVIISGGPHATLIPDEVLRNGFDIVVRGEGERTIVELLGALKNNKPLNTIAGVSFKNDKGEAVNNPDRPLIEDLDSLPFPDYGLLDMNNYSMDRSGSLKIFSVLSSRSCPSQCIYCANARLFRGKHRTRSAENIFREVMGLKEKYDVKYIRFVDDALTIQRDRIHKLMELMKSRKELKGLRWECDSRVDCVDEDLLRAMKDSGCAAIIYGVESYDDESLTLMKKGINTRKIDRAIEMTKKVGLFMNVNTIIGFKWETRKHINNTLKLLNINYANCQYPCGIPIPWPGTELYDRYKQELGFGDWWLKEEYFPESCLAGRARPFYSRCFIGINNVTWTEKNMDLWAMDKGMRRVIYSAIFKLSRRSLLNVQGRIKGSVLYYLGRVSLALFNINPSIEQNFFSVLKKIWSLNKEVFGILPKGFRK